MLTELLELTRGQARQDADRWTTPSGGYAQFASPSVRRNREIVSRILDHLGVGWHFSGPASDEPRRNNVLLIAVEESERVSDEAIVQAVNAYPEFADEAIRVVRMEPRLGG